MCFVKVSFKGFFVLEKKMRWNNLIIYVFGIFFFGFGWGVKGDLFLKYGSVNGGLILKWSKRDDFFLEFFVKNLIVFFIKLKIFNIVLVMKSVVGVFLVGFEKIMFISCLEVLFNREILVVVRRLVFLGMLGVFWLLDDSVEMLLVISSNVSSVLVIFDFFIC